jgi:hypothetical protein
MSTMAEEQPTRAIANAVERIRAAVRAAKPLLEDPRDVAVLEFLEETIDEEGAIIDRALTACRATSHA